eukprot:c13691_g1_i1.p1 GENE.c13691_g1_i1~~c13691_g1_i1.p1  ORF type:complete len:475 (-),score=201.10 c13691_g1_i1:73-1497(-)
MADNVPLLITRPALHIGEAVDHAGFGKHQIYMFLACSFCWLVSSIALESVTWLIEHLQLNSTFFLSSSERGLLAMGTPIGILFGSPIFGIMSDIYGRSKPILICLYFTTILFLLNLVASSFEALFLFRVLIGLFCGGLEMIPNNLFIETTPTSWRNHLRPLMHIAWNLGSVLCIGFASAVTPGDYHSFNILCVLPGLLACVLTTYWFLFNESPHFLHVVGKTQEAEETIKGMAERNNVSLPEDMRLIDLGFQNEEEYDMKTRLKELFHPDLRLATLLLAFMFAFITSSYYLSFVYFADYLHLTESSKTVHIVYTAIPAGRFVGALVTSAVLNDYGALRLMELSGLFCGACALCLLATTNVTFLWIDHFLMFLFFEVSYCSLYSYAPELYPTSIRGTAIGILAAIGDSSDIVFSFLGSVLAERYPASPVIAAGAMMTFVSFCSLILAFTHGETTGSHLPETVTTESRSNRVSIRV